MWLIPHSLSGDKLFIFFFRKLIFRIFQILAVIHVWWTVLHLGSLVDKEGSFQGWLSTCHTSEHAPPCNPAYILTALAECEGHVSPLPWLSSLPNHRKPLWFFFCVFTIVRLDISCISQPKWNDEVERKAEALPHVDLSIWSWFVCFETAQKKKKDNAKIRSQIKNDEETVTSWS